MTFAQEPSERGWVHALQRASLDWRPPMTPLEWEAVKAHTITLPPDLRTLYGVMNGAQLPAGLRVFPLRAGPGEPSTLRHSHEPHAGFGTSGVWRFGRKGPRIHLFAVQRGKIRGRADGTPLPEWLQSFDGDAWVYGLRDDHTFQTRLFHALGPMLDSLLPAAPPVSAPAEIEVDLSADDSVEVELDIEVEHDSDPELELEVVVEEPAHAAPAKPKKRRGVKTPKPKPKPKKTGSKKPSRRKLKAPPKKRRKAARR